MLSGESLPDGISKKSLTVFSALAALEDNAGDAGSAPATADVDSKEAKASE
jgi:hypothetical protein